VKEGQYVKKEEPCWARIGCDDLQANLQTATAEADSGAPGENQDIAWRRVTKKKKIASEKTAAARATFEEAKIAAGDAARSVSKGTDFPVFLRASCPAIWAWADANLKAAVRTEELLAAPPLQEDQAKADAEVVAGGGPHSHSSGAHREVLNSCSDRRKPS